MNIFGLPPQKQAQLVFLPVPWEVTTSYGRGTAQGPQAILQASQQVDLFDLDLFRFVDVGLQLLPESEQVHQWNHQGISWVDRLREAHSNEQEMLLARVNQLGASLNTWVYRETRRVREQGQWLGILGGEHSVAFGGIQAMAQEYSSLGVLQIDAHADTRQAYEGIQWSHASVMRNVLDLVPEVTQLTQVGIRDFCEEEWKVGKNNSRVKMFYDRDLARARFRGKTWDVLVQEILSGLPQNVWISFDIDGLDAQLCPHTGTPVPGGLSFHEVSYLIEMLVRSSRRIIGFDLSEVSPGVTEWDANVGARILYQLSGWLLASQGLTHFEVREPNK